MITQNPSLSSPASDPLRNFKFQVTFKPSKGASVPMSFMTCSGLSETVDTIPYREGTHNTTTQKLPGQTDFGPITFTKGVMFGSQPQIEWIQRLFVVRRGTGSQAGGQDFRSTVQILVLDHPVTTGQDAVKASFTVVNAWPTALAFSDLDAGANQLFISQMTLAHEGFIPSIAAAAGSAEASYTAA